MVKAFYQGTIEQIDEIINLLPNLKKAYLLGNPDCSVDPEFCSEAAKHFINNGIHVMFSTSGIGGKETVKTLLNELDTSFIDYVSFSIDSLDDSTEKLLKGKNISFSTLLEGIQYCQSKSIPVKIQPTVWQINQNHCIELMDFFSSNYDIKWFTFHVGSQEGFFPKKSKVCQHVLPDEWHKIRLDIEDYAKKHNLHVNVPIIFATEEEYLEYNNNYLPHCINPHPTNIQIRMEKTLQATLYPILGTIYPNEFCSTLNSNIMVSSQIDVSTNACIAQNFCLGKNLFPEFKGSCWEKDNKKYFYVCRYYKTII